MFGVGVLKIVCSGVYWISPGFGALRDALRCQGDKEYVREQLGSLMLIELEVTDAVEPLDLGEIHQPGNTNVPYDEWYYSTDRRTLLGKQFDPLPVGSFAVAFYLHCFERGKPLETPCGNIQLPEPQIELPQHLRNRRYTYYD